MGNRKFISLACMLAFAVVLLHSAIPHSHHCIVRENHIHHLYNCEQLNTYLQSSDSLHVFVAGDALASESPSAERCDRPELIRFDLSCRFISVPASAFLQPSLRGPPRS